MPLTKPRTGENPPRNSQFEPTLVPSGLTTVLPFRLAVSGVSAASEVVPKYTAVNTSEGTYILFAEVAVSVRVTVSVLPLKLNWALAARTFPEAPLVPPPVNVMEVANAVETKRFNAAKRIVLMGK